MSAAEGLMGFVAFLYRKVRFYITLALVTVLLLIAATYVPKQWQEIASNACPLVCIFTIPIGGVLMLWALIREQWGQYKEEQNNKRMVAKWRQEQGLK